MPKMKARKCLSNEVLKELRKIEGRKSKYGFLKRDVEMLENLFSEYIGPINIVQQQIGDRKKILKEMGINDVKLNVNKLYLENLKGLEYLPKKMSQEELNSMKKNALPSHYQTLRHIYGLDDEMIEIL